MGSDVEIRDVAISRLGESLEGRLIGPRDPDYGDARRVFNGMMDRRPALIARVAGAGDVSRCLAFAQDHGLPVAIRGGGHNVAGNAVCDGGLVIDFSECRGVRRTGRVRGSERTTDSQLYRPHRR